MMKKIITVVVILLWNTDVCGVSISSNVNITSFKAPCEDEVHDCGYLHKDELCNRTGKYMRYAAIACRKTCGYCTDYCVDTATNCTDFTFDETCINISLWSLINCPVYCGYCGVLGRSCNASTYHICARIPGASCISNVCTCNAGFRPVAHIECEEVYWKKCNASEDCDRLDNSVCQIPQNPETSHSPWTNSTHCICKSGYAYNFGNHSCDADCSSTLPTISNGNVTLATTYTTVGAEANVMCDMRFYTDNPYLTCIQSGSNASWSYSTCEPVLGRLCDDKSSCSDAEHALCLQSGSMAGVTCQCSPGFKSADGISCIEVHSTICKASYDCMSLPNSECSKSNTTPSTDRCLCKGGFFYNGTNHYCDKVCPPPLNGSHAVLKPESLKLSNYIYNDVVGYKCETGYEFNKSDSSDVTRTSKCKENKTWSITPACTIKVCPPPLNGSHAVLKPESLKLSNYIYNDVVGYKCETGYEFNKSDSSDVTRTSKCKENKTWSITPACTIKANITPFMATCEDEVPDCGDLHRDELCNRTGKFRRYAALVCRKTCDYCTDHCVDNATNCYNLTFEACHENITWSLTNCPVYCGFCVYINFKIFLSKTTRPNCGNLKDPANGKADMANGTTYLSVGRYNCNVGFTLSGNNNTICTERGNWSEHSVNCSINDCKQPRNVSSNGRVNTANGTTYGSVITFSCNVGYDLIGDEHAICLANSAWNVAPPICIITDSCSVNCFPQPTNMAVSCDVTSGECLYGCQHGFAGHKCLFKCPHNCGNSTNSTEICNTSTSECLFGCKEGFYGQNCTETCSSIDRNCKACHQGTDGSGYVCTECNRNFYRDNDRCRACNYWCKVNVTSTLSICRESDGFCEFGCKPGRFGYHCSQRCSNTCKDVCHRDTGRCLTGCIFQGYCGPTCEITCNDGCTSQQCDQSCNCLHTCIPSRWGKRCELLCNSNCKHPQDVSMNICNITDGSCIYGCLNNSYWGSQCEHRCPSNCVSGSCHQISNICDKGCVNNRFYGGNCSIPCSQNCLNLTCTRGSGYCEHGCQPGWYGDTCDRQCGDSCFGKSCNQSDGKCLAGCQTGWYGKYCTQTCNDRCAKRTCSADTGNCSQGCVTGFQGSQCDIALSTSRMCFGCDDMSSPQFCDAVVHCKSNEICFLESHISGHEKNFRSGCMDARTCHRIESNASSVCVECCTTDMCNNRGCGNSDFPAREQRGPVCFDCHHTGNPNTCEKVAMCSSNQVCSIEKFQWGDSFHYKQGCAHPVCNPLSRRKRSLPICHSCCDADYCNLNCTADATSVGDIFVG